MINHYLLQTQNDKQLVKIVEKELVVLCKMLCCASESMDYPSTFFMKNDSKNM